MSNPHWQQDVDEENRAEETPADHWNKIMELAAEIKRQATDLAEMLKDFNKSAL